MIEIDKATAQRMRKHYGDGVDPWISACSDMIEELKRKWDLRSVIAIEGGIAGCVFGCESQYGECVLKGSPDVETLQAEIHALLAWKSSNVVPQIYNVAPDFYLMERIRPGNIWTGSEENVINALSILHATAITIHEDIPHAHDQLVKRLQSLKQNVGNRTPLQDRHFDIAIEKVSVLPKVQETVVHADLHPGAILEGQYSPVFIDPMTSWGVSGYDLAAYVGKSPTLDIEKVIRTGCSSMKCDESYVKTISRAISIEEVAVIFKFGLPVSNQQIVRWISWAESDW